MWHGGGGEAASAGRRTAVWCVPGRLGGTSGRDVPAAQISRLGVDICRDVVFTWGMTDIAMIESPSVVVISRSARRVTLRDDDGKSVRRRVRVVASVESCDPFGTFSLSPVLTARTSTIGAAS